MLPRVKISQAVGVKLDVTTLNRAFSVFVFIKNLLVTIRSLCAFELTYECTRSE